MDEEFCNAAEFHGHFCPGLAIGYRVAKYVKEHFPRAQDEELVAVVENNSCSIDAIQYVLGCTFGKGNLIFRDHGKQAFTFFSRDKGRAIRIYFKKCMARPGPGAGPEIMASFREKAMEEILNSPDEELLDIREVAVPAPPKARIYPSLVCQSCGECFMEIQGHTAGGLVVCEDCFQKMVS